MALTITLSTQIRFSFSTVPLGPLICSNRDATDPLKISKVIGLLIVTVNSCKIASEVPLGYHFSEPSIKKEEVVLSK
jgi:hypothetical protein